MQNICKFIPPNKTADHIQPINFVLETKQDTPTILSPCAVYRMHFVVDGEGEVRCGDAVRTVRAGAVFFAFPATYVSITSTQSLKYMYISYIGIRARFEMERLGINYKNFVFEGFESLRGIWTESIAVSPEMIDLASESVLLYTFSQIGSRDLRGESDRERAQSDENFTLVKKYIDENFANSELCRDSIAERFCYDKNYISTLFKKKFQLGISEYINTVRINEAHAYIEQGCRSVSEVSAKVGFNDALYFSKVFKKKTGLSPKEFMQSLDKRDGGNEKKC